MKNSQRLHATIITIALACGMIMHTGQFFQKVMAQTSQIEAPSQKDFSANDEETAINAGPGINEQQEFLKARILQITNEKQDTGLDGIKTYIQSYILQGVDGKWKNQEISIKNSEFNTTGLNAYKVGDVLLVANTKDSEGKERFFVVDYVRENAMYLLGFLFVGMVILIGGKKGVKATASLLISFFVIIWYILPQIIQGADPIMVSITGAIVITVISMYLTYGFRYFTHIGAVSMGASLIFTVIISQVFTEWTKLTGVAEEESTSITQLLGSNFNLKGLLLASFIIGAIGVLDDVIINQVSLIEELHRTDSSMNWKNLFKRGLKVGVDHISAIVNTLFLAYVGASLPLLVVFSADKMSKYDYTTMMNLEIIATEIVRTLTGSLGLIFAVPISTFIAAIFIPKYFKKHQDLLKKKGFSPHVH